MLFQNSSHSNLKCEFPIQGATMNFRTLRRRLRVNIPLCWYVYWPRRLSVISRLKRLDF